MRENLSSFEILGAEDNPQRKAIEECPKGAVLGIDGQGETGCGALGDILVARLKHRGVVGVVADCAMRDAAGIAPLGLPIWCSGAAAPPNIGALALGDRQTRIGCGGVAVDPGDVIVADGDGVAVIPSALADEVARDGAEQERFERFVQIKVTKRRVHHRALPTE